MVRATRLALVLAIATAIAASTATAAATADPAASSGSVGVTAPAAPSVARALTPAENAELVALSDPDTLTDLHEGQRRMERITDILTGAKDRRGIFAVFYRNILRDANPLLDAGDFDDPQWARAVSFEFFRTYLENLHGHLTGGPVTPGWQRYYAMAADPTRSAGRVAAAALDAHLLVDFPKAIAATDTGVDHTRDFFTIGDSLINTTDHITDELSALYGAKLAGFFHLYFVGRAADVVLGQGNTSYVMFQSVRGIALASGIAMRDAATRRPAEASMRELYNLAESVFNGLEAVGQI
ncbi:DUF5995 family protein [Nocardia sp. CDC153]|uniref:DUF5995 family protein n=1 Tax=Nocardia sp. CDC153 TaxID=3112167 RepID=UPI002DBDE292|nr:DUF5995 family protein [Nocardia sp. CDC153]MEC3954281.1 DUF5995 family protein [Nocardia sp. CDC153]